MTNSKHENIYNKIGKNIPSDLELIQKCIECDNYEILIFLLDWPMNHLF